MPNNINIQKIISVLLHRLKFILLAAVLGAALFYSYSKFIITPMYSTSAMVFIQNFNESREGINEKNQKIYSSDINGSCVLADICVTLFKNSDDITSLYDGCYVDMTLEPETFFLKISVSGSDPQKCANVANQIGEATKKVFKENFMYGKVGFIRQAKVPASPYEPNNNKYGLIGFVVGLVASCLICILLELIDTTIKSDDDIREIYGVPVFAQIPDFDSQGR